MCSCGNPRCACDTKGTSSQRQPEPSERDVSGKGWNFFTAAGGGLVSPGGEGHLYFGPIFDCTDPKQYRGNFLTLSGNTPPALPYPGVGGGIFGWPFGKGSPWGFKLGPVYGTPGFSLVWQWYKQWTGVK